MEDALRLVAQAHQMVGLPDIRKPAHSPALDYRLSQLLSAYARADPPPFRVKPIPFPILFRAAALARARNTAKGDCLADILWIATFFLLRPGEYSKPTTEDASPFRFCDVTFHRGNARLNSYHSDLADLQLSTLVTLTFTTQKNADRNAVVGHGPNQHLEANPVRALARRLYYLRTQGADPDTLLCSYRHGNTWQHLAAGDLTLLLRTAAALMPDYNVPAAEISARSLRATGAMALLNASVDTDVIRLMGRWNSDAMLRYLHVQAHAPVRQFAQLMLQGGDYALLPPGAPLVPLH